MRPLLLGITVFTLVFSGTWWYRETAHVCPVPIYYRIGAVDDRFAFTNQSAQEVALRAEAVWEVATGRELFVYDDTAEFTINFIYDERQQRASTEEEWRNALDREESENKRRTEEVERLSAAYAAAEQAYLATRESYETKLVAYNAEVERYNSLGGAPEEEYARLQAEAVEIEELRDELLENERQLEREASQINEKGEAVNKSIAAYNAEVLEYNEIFGSAETFTQGDFERERINVYKFSDVVELEAVLVHEFGHALGIGHVEDDTAVMYYLQTQSDSLVLTEADTTAFFAVCGKAPTVASTVRQFIRTIVGYIS